MIMSTKAYYGDVTLFTESYSHNQTHILIVMQEADMVQCSPQNNQWLWWYFFTMLFIFQQPLKHLEFWVCMSTCVSTHTCIIFYQYYTEYNC